MPHLDDVESRPLVFLGVVMGILRRIAEFLA